MKQSLSPIVENPGFEDKSFDNESHLYHDSGKMTSEELKESHTKSIPVSSKPSNVSRKAKNNEDRSLKEIKKQPETFSQYEDRQLHLKEKDTKSKGHRNRQQQNRNQNQSHSQSLDQTLRESQSTTNQHNTVLLSDTYVNDFKIIEQQSEAAKYELLQQLRQQQNSTISQQEENEIEAMVDDFFKETFDEFYKNVTMLSDAKFTDEEKKKGLVELRLDKNLYKQNEISTDLLRKGLLRNHQMGWRVKEGLVENEGGRLLQNVEFGNRDGEKVSYRDDRLLNVEKDLGEKEDRGDRDNAFEKQLLIRTAKKHSKIPKVFMEEDNGLQGRQFFYKESDYLDAVPENLLQDYEKVVSKLQVEVIERTKRLAEIKRHYQQTISQLNLRAKKLKFDFYAELS